MSRLKYVLWGTSNAFWAIVTAALGWLTTALAAMTLESAWPASILLTILAAIAAVLVPGFLAAQAVTCFLLAELAKTTTERLAHLKVVAGSFIMVLDTKDKRAVWWQRLSIIAGLPGVRGALAALLLTAAGGLALAGLLQWQWPWWASILLLIPWAAGCFWYVREVRARANSRNARWIY